MKRDAVQASFIMMEKYRFKRTGKRKWQKMEKKDHWKILRKNCVPSWLPVTLKTIRGPCRPKHASAFGILSSP
jgi:hypothetical protein